MSLTYTIPGKTFLAGEYLALQEGPTLVFNSQPCFELKVKTGSGQLHNIHLDSPAGVFVSKHSDFFGNYDLQFQDPYGGRGGLGASTAQFLGAYAFFKSREQGATALTNISVPTLLQAYYEVAWSGEGPRPSGADLVGQLHGGLTVFDKSQNQTEVISWPFEDLNFFLVHTGNKVATHEHLKNLQEFSVENLRGAFAILIQALQEKNSDGFVQGINAYGQALRELNLTCQPTLDLLREVRMHPGVLAVKGCGALGADIILVVFRASASLALVNFFNTKNLSIVSSNKDLSSGLSVRGLL